MRTIDLARTTQLCVATVALITATAPPAATSSDHDVVQRERLSARYRGAGFAHTPVGP